MSIEYVASSSLPTRWGEFTMHGFVIPETNHEHIALTLGQWQPDEAVLGRIHSECLTGDALFSQRCDCGYQLEAAMRQIQKVGRGFILYLRQEGRGIGLLNKIKAYALQDQGMDTVQANLHLGFPADMRDFSMCQPMLAHLGIKRVRLMTNNPDKLKAMQDAGIDVVERVALQVGDNPHNHFYLQTKANRMGHLLNLDD
ncbi:GTP cyclohydrolase II [Celerinatantimonas sp. YJH-8]|uniref:GTP cyclohydrolase II n=1 Tax=Celerinatantimonas sp. YJH-8 TaxID=3228714 RepID=UPI0038CB4C54